MGQTNTGWSRGDIISNVDCLSLSRGVQHHRQPKGVAQLSKHSNAAEFTHSPSLSGHGRGTHSFRMAPQRGAIRGRGSEEMYEVSVIGFIPDSSSAVAPWVISRIECGAKEENRDA